MDNRVLKAIKLVLYDSISYKGLKQWRLKMKRNSIMAILCLPILLLACGNPNQTGPDEHEENPIQEADVDMQTLESAKSFLTVKTVITKSESSINLPSSVAGYEGVTVSWSSGDESVISINGTVAHQSGTGSDTVNLTATLSLNGKTATKVFEITVYQTNAELSDEEVLEAAASDLEADASELYAEYLNADILSPYTLNLNDSVVIDGKNVSVSWTSGSDDDHFSLSGNNLTIERDIVDIPVSLKGILTYNGESCEKTITFAIPCISQFVFTHSSTSSQDLKTYSFDGNKMIATYRRTESYNGETKGWLYGGEYSYSADVSNKTITLTKINQLEDGVWYTKSEFKSLIEGYWNHDGVEMKKLDSDPTIKNLASAYYDNMENVVYRVLVEHGYFPDGVTVDNAADQSESVKRTAVRQYWDDEIERMRDLLDMSEAANHTQIIDAYVQYKIDDDFRGCFPPPIVYDYDILYSASDEWHNNISFTAIMAWESGKHWYEMVYANFNSGSPENVYLGYERGYSFFSLNSSISGEVLFNEDFTSFTWRSTSKPVVEDDDREWYVTEDLTTKKISVSNGHGKTYDLYFEESTFSY